MYMYSHPLGLFLSLSVFMVPMKSPSSRISVDSLNSIIIFISWRKPFFVATLAYSCVYLNLECYAGRDSNLQQFPQFSSFVGWH